MNKQPESEIFTIPARRCKRCGGLLTSAQAIRATFKVIKGGRW